MQQMKLRRSDSWRVVVVGGGIGGAELVRNAATKEGLDLVLVEPKDRIECQALYPDYLGGGIEIEDMTAPLDPFCRKMDAVHVKDRALAVDFADKRISCERGDLDYDLLVLAPGAVQNYFGVEGAEKAFSINTLEETVKARRFVEKKRPKKIAIIGSGPTGIETACFLAEKTTSAVYIIEMMDRLLPTLSKNASILMEKILVGKGVEVLTRKQVSSIRDGGVTFADNSSLECDMTIWTAGVRAAPLIERLDLPKKKGWLLCDQYLRAWEREDVFVIGDCGWIEIGGKLATKTGMEAEIQAKHTARNLARVAKGEPLKPYSIRASTDSPVALISTGCGCAVGIYGDLCVPIPKRIIYTFKSWIDKSFVKRFKV
ncbi:MAG: FAD-dependent oxidoreductase [Methanothrix sp.]|nr:FAD-dependent oxidoreductase [Methanothrix sp.]